LKSSDVEIAYSFCTEFFELLTEKAINKRLIRLIKDKTVSFGPKRKGPNLLINKFMKSEESMFQRLRIIVKEYIGTDILE
jgi:hypothetical protein